VEYTTLSLLIFNKTRIGVSLGFIWLEIHVYNLVPSFFDGSGLLFSGSMRGFFVEEMEKPNWNEVKKILCRQKEFNQVNNIALHHISTKISEME
jgi:hypothetical protein